MWNINICILYVFLNGESILNIDYEYNYNYKINMNPYMLSVSTVTDLVFTI